MNAALVEEFLQLLSAGLMLGCTYGLMCVALGLIFGVMRLINFAQGDFLMLGMYFAMLFTSPLAPLTSIGALHPHGDRCRDCCRSPSSSCSAGLLHAELIKSLIEKSGHRNDRNRAKSPDAAHG